MHAGAPASHILSEEIVTVGELEEKMAGRGAPGSGGQGSVSGLPLDPSRDGKSRTVLVVDDDESIRNIVQCALKALEYRVVTVCDGTEAIDFYARSPGETGVVILDLIMPRMNGRQTLMHLKSLDPGVRVIIMTGHQPPDLKEILADPSVRGYLPKPFSMKALVESVAAAMAAKPI